MTSAPRMPTNRAARWELHSCSHCPNPHVVLYNENEEVIGDFTLGPGEEDLLAQKCKELRGLIRLQQVKRQNQAGDC